LLRQLRSANLHFEWYKAEPRSALLCLPAVAAAVAVPVAMGRPQLALLLTVGAVTAGFGSFQRPLYFRGGPMILVSFGIALAAMLGAVTAVWTPYLALAAMVFAFAYGMAGAISASASWIGLQCCIFLLISSSVPLHGGDLLARGEGIVLGGLLQSAVMLVLWQFTPPAASSFFTNPNAGPPVSLHEQWRILRRNLNFGSPVFRHALRLSVAALVSVGVYHRMHYVSGYWIPMTTLIILNPEMYHTAHRAIARVTGTIAGAVLCTFIVALLRPQAGLLVLLVIVFVGAAFWLQFVNYSAFATVLTGYIVFVLAINHFPERQIVVHRVIATLIGGAIALLVHYMSHRAEGWWEERKLLEQ
jgi:hypothetical protein